MNDDKDDDEQQQHSLPESHPSFAMTTARAEDRGGVWDTWTRRGRGPADGWWYPRSPGATHIRVERERHQVPGAPRLHPARIDRLCATRGTSSGWREEGAEEDIATTIGLLSLLFS